jgi:hypothetical protein
MPNTELFSIMMDALGFKRSVNGSNVAKGDGRTNTE